MQIKPVSQSQLTIVSQSSQTYTVTVGENVEYKATVALPEGTTILPTFVVSFPRFMAVSYVTVINYSPNMLPVVRHSTLVDDTNDDGVKDTVTVFFSALQNQPDNVVDSNDNVTILIVGNVLVGAPIGSRLNVTSRFTYENGTTPITISDTPQTVSVTVGQPTLMWSVKWSSSSGAAGDVVQASVLLYQATQATIPVYNIRVQPTLAPGVTLVPGSMGANRANATFTNDGLMQLAVLPPGANVTFNFSVVLDVSVQPGSNLTNIIVANYSTGATVSGRLYLLPLFFFLLF